MTQSSKLRKSHQEPTAADSGSVANRLSALRIMSIATSLPVLGSFLLVPAIVAACTLFGQGIDGFTTHPDGLAVGAFRKHQDLGFFTFWLFAAPLIAILFPSFAWLACRKELQAIRVRR